MKYVSTRGNAPEVNATTALLNGIAPDGGLYVPAELPPSVPEFFGEDYAGTMEKLLALFFDDVPARVRQDAILNSAARFRECEFVPLEQKGENTYFLNLYSGPTLAFKDVALTILPHLLQYAAKSAGLERAAILTATSGDTGSAAMSGFAGVAGTEVLVFYPQTGTSEIQRRQMVCCAGENVHACAIEGNFDDAQAGVKAVFTDSEIRDAAAKKGVFLSSANSINIGRLFPQICYYLETWRRLKKSGALDATGTFDVVVPTGNFGNVLAANFAKKLGAPIRRLIVASNENRVVADFITTGTYDRRREFKITNSPSMDILVSSNVERLLFDILGRDPVRLRAHMDALKNSGTFSLDETAFSVLRENYRAGVASVPETEATIKSIWETTGYLTDPHTATAWKVLQEQTCRRVPAVIAATASAWKFPATMLRALTGRAGENDFENLRALEKWTRRRALLTELEDAPVLHKMTCAKNAVAETVRHVFKI